METKGITTDKLKIEMSKKKERLPLPEQIVRQFNSDSFKSYEEDQKNCLEGWQHYERANRTDKFRYKSDKEAYKNAFFGKDHDHSAKFDENLLITRLIKNLQKATHPVFIQYRAFLEKKLAPTIEKDSNELDTDLSKAKATEKIVYLKKLGVLNFLRTKRPFNTSINSLASILSVITDEHNTTLQPYLNAMYGKNVDTSKDPCNTKKTVDKVESRLISIGFQLK
jgi:hypothetical protein